jgi:hypothetical protein
VKLIYLINGLEKPSCSLFINQFQILSSNNGIGSTIGMDTTNINLELTIGGGRIQVL